MRIALVVPGGVDRSGEFRVIPALLALIGRLSIDHNVRVFALSQEIEAGKWTCAGAQVYNIGRGFTRPRAILAIHWAHRRLPFEIIHAIWSGACGLVAMTAGRLLGIPSMIHVAGGELVSIPDIRFGGMQTWRGRLREPWVLRAAGAVTGASAPVIEALSRLGVVAERVPLGVDRQAWPPRNPVPRDEGRPARLIHVASLNRVKDQFTLLRALQAIMKSGVKFEMDIVGEDTLRGEIQALATDLELNAVVRFHGFLMQRQLLPLIQKADLMVHTSRYETGPVVVLEAAIVGVPTVGTAVGHIGEWAPTAALAVPVGDWRALASAIGRLLADDALRMKIAQEAFGRALHEDADHTAATFQLLYRRLIL